MRTLECAITGIIEQDIISHLQASLHTGHIPSGYRPPMPTLLTAYNVTIIGGILENGNLTVQTSSTGSKTINLSGVWHY